MALAFMGLELSFHVTEFSGVRQRPALTGRYKQLPLIANPHTDPRISLGIC